MASKKSGSNVSGHPVQPSDFIVVGANGLIGASLTLFLKRQGASVIEVHSENYDQMSHAQAKVLVNCNGSSYRFRAAQSPQTDFEVNVQTVKNTIFDFDYDLYIYCSTVDVYTSKYSSSGAMETEHIKSADLHPYGFHKWLAERLVERYANNYLILRLGSVVGPNLKKGPIFDILNGDLLFLSPRSKLTFIYTEWIAKVIEKLSLRISQQEIYNVTGFGEVLLEKLSKKYGNRQIRVKKNSIQTRYSINTDKLGQVMELPNSEIMIDLYVRNTFGL